MEAAQLDKMENEKITSQRKALETAKQMLHQTRGESKSPEMDWDYYGVNTGEREQLRQEGKVVDQRMGKGGAKEIPKMAASTPLEEEKYPREYSTFGLSIVEKQYSCKNCQRKYEPPLCKCPNCG